MAVSAETIEVLTKGSTTVFGSEREFREKVVSRLLESLGWNSAGDTQYEVPIQAGTIVLKVDYVVGSNNKFAMETKKPGIDISPGSSAWNQIVSYLRLDPTLLYGVLYNGKDLHILDSHRQEPLVSWSLGKSPGMFDLLKKEYFPELLQLYTSSNISGSISSEKYSSITSPIIAEIDRNNRQMADGKKIAEQLKRKRRRYLLFTLLALFFAVIVVAIDNGSGGKTIPILSPIFIVSGLCFTAFPIVALYYEIRFIVVKRQFHLH
ncbi:hypothetical protein Thermo_00120 [Thermoplasmatales archaeon]|nr:hypothetical protein Thermo_00120 [Thermoplasmatales archaeon]